MKKTFALLLIILLPALAAAQNSPLVFRNVNLIDMTSEQTKPNMTVIVNGTRVSKIGKNLKIPKGAQIVDASGKFLIPGLWDMHVHIFNNVSAPGTNNKDTYFPLFITNGVTGVRDMFTDADDIKLVRQWQEQMEAGKLLAPRIIPASSIIDGVPVIQANSVGVTGAEDARRVVREFKAAGANFIKVYSNLSRESFFAIADEAKKLGIPFAGHVPDSVTATEASAAGQKSLEHQERMLIACSSTEDKFKDLKKTEWTPALRAELLSSYDEDKCRQTAAVLIKNGTWLDPTFVVNRSLMLGDDERFQKDARLVYVSANERQDWIKFAGFFKPATRKHREARFRIEIEVLKIMHQAGVPVLAGTDVGNPFIYAGFSLHDELENFVQAGFTPFEALQTATVNPAKYTGLEKSLGTIEKGKLADLVLLDANPLENIGNTKRIYAVVAGGRYLPKESLGKMLEDVQAQVKKK